MSASYFVSICSGADDVAALLKRTYENQIALFFEIMEIIAEGKELPISEETGLRPRSHASSSTSYSVSRRANQEMRSSDVFGEKLRSLSALCGDRGLPVEYKPDQK